MNQNPLISIILPTYNRAELLPRAINSVLTQTYQYWELLIWNDGSEDDTEKVVKSFEDERIRYFIDSNHGMSYALNRAIKEIRGQYIAFIDDDDCLLPSKLELQMKIMLEHPEVEMVFGNFLNENMVTGEKGEGFRQCMAGLNQLTILNIDDYTKLIIDGFLKGIARDNFIAFDTVLISRKVVDRIGAFNEGLRNSMDFEYWWRFGLAGGRAAYTEKIVLNRIKYPGSLSGRSLKTIENQIKALDACSDFSVFFKQEETLKYLRSAYRNAWHNMITACACAGNLQGMLSAFRHSIKYGFRLGALRLLLVGVIVLSRNKIDQSLSDK